MHYTFKTLSMQLHCALVNKPSNAQRNLAVSFTTCAPQHAPHLLNYLRTSTLATYAAAPTTPPHTLLLVHPNFAATYATSIQVLRNPQVVHKHVSWGILCTFIAATHEATTPPT